MYELWIVYEVEAEDDDDDEDDEKNPFVCEKKCCTKCCENMINFSALLLCTQWESHIIFELRHSK